jgi:hypothetical protein
LIDCAGSTTSAAVDIFNASSGRWSTASLSVARAGLAATSLPKQGLAIFAGELAYDVGGHDMFLLVADGSRRWRSERV